MEQEQITGREVKQNYAFTAMPSIVEQAKENAWLSRKSFSEVIEKLLVEYNRKQLKGKS